MPLLSLLLLVASPTPIVPTPTRVALRPVPSAPVLRSAAQVPDDDAREDRSELDRVEKLTSEGRVEDARAALVQWMAAGIEVQCEELSSEQAVDLAIRVDGLAAALELLDVRLEVTEFIHTTRERIHEPDDFELVVAKAQLAVARQAVGDLVGARELLEHVHATWERLLPADDTDLLIAKLNLAAVCTELGDLVGARAMEEQVHAAWSRLLPAEHPNLLAVKFNLAVTRSKLGDLAGAVDLQEYVLAVWERSLPSDHPQVLTGKLNLAVTRKALGDVAGALELEEYVLAARERALPADHPQILATQLNLAGTRRQLGDHAGAAALFEHVHATWERMLPPDHANLIGVKLNLALARRSVGDLAGARELLEEVHSGWQQRLPEDHPELLAAKIDLAGVLLASGERDRARELLEHVHAVRARVLSSDDPQLLEAQQDLCAVLVAEGAHGRLRELCGALLAGQSARSASVSTLATRVARTAALRELERLAWVASWSEIADEPGAPALAPALFEVLEGLRLVSTSSAQVSSALARSTQLAALHASLGEARRELSNASQTPPSAAAELESWRDQLVALAEKRDGLERDLRRELAAHGARVELPTVEALASRLAGDQVYVGFWRCLRHRSASPGSLEYTATDALRAFVVRSDGSVALVELGAAAPLEALATRWRAALGKPIERGIEDPSSADDTELAAGQALRAALLDPVFAALGDGELRTLFVVPDDFVHVVPLDALPRADGTLLGESIAVRVEPSAARLTREAPVFDSNGTLVAFGGVDFSATEVEPAVHAVSVATPAHERSSSTGFAPLLSSRIEAQFAATLYQDHVGAEPLLRLGKEASEATLVALAPRARYLHIATHGWFAERSKAVSMLDAFEGGANAVGRLAVERTQETIVGFLPETLCGLALAGANHGPEGILTAEELATLDLANCELAVLSACETNVGIRRAGQGIQSLQTALHAAGARTAITSLWKVDDAATRRLFELFYTKLWSENLGPADALWQAKMALKGEGHPTRDWAGWVLTGVGD